MSRGLTHIFKCHYRLRFRKDLRVFILGKAIFLVHSHEQISHFLSLTILYLAVAIAFIKHIHSKMISLDGRLFQPVFSFFGIIIFKKPTGIEILRVSVAVLCLEPQNSFVVTVLSVPDIIIIKLALFGNIREHFRGRLHHKVPQRFEFFICFQRYLFWHLISIVTIIFTLKIIPKVIELGYLLIQGNHFHDFIHQILVFL